MGAGQPAPGGKYLLCGALGASSGPEDASGTQEAPWGLGEGDGGQMLKTRSRPERVRPSGRQGVPGRPDSLRGPGCECQNDLKQ